MSSLYSAEGPVLSNSLRETSGSKPLDTVSLDTGVGFSLDGSRDTSREPSESGVTGNRDSSSSSASNYPSSHVNMVKRQSLRYESSVVTDVKKEVNSKRLPPRTVLPDKGTVNDSVDARPSADLEIEKVKSATLCIDVSTTFCEIETVKYKRERLRKPVKRHFVKETLNFNVQGNKGLEIFDELVKVNGKKLRGKNQKKVLKIFKKISPSEKTGKIEIELILNRWESNEAVTTVYKVTVELSLERVGRGSVRANSRSSSVKLREGKSKLLDVTYINMCEKQIRLRDKDGGFYLMAGSNGSVVARQIEGQEPAEVFWFKAMDNKYPLCVAVVAYAGKGTGETSKQYLSTGSENTVLRFITDCAKPGKGSPVDTRFFIVRQEGNMTVFESAIHRGKYVQYTDSGSFRLHQVDQKYLEDLDDDHWHDCVFEVFDP